MRYNGLYIVQRTNWRPRWDHESFFCNVCPSRTLVLPFWPQILCLPRAADPFPLLVLVDIDFDRRSATCFRISLHGFRAHLSAKRGRPLHPPRPKFGAFEAAEAAEPGRKRLLVPDSFGAPYITERSRCSSKPAASRIDILVP